MKYHRGRILQFCRVCAFRTNPEKLRFFEVSLHNSSLESSNSLWETSNPFLPHDYYSFFELLQLNEFQYLCEPLCLYKTTLILLYLRILFGFDKRSSSWLVQHTTTEGKAPSNQTQSSIIFWRSLWMNRIFHYEANDRMTLCYRTIHEVNESSRYRNSQ